MTSPPTQINDLVQNVMSSHSDQPARYVVVTKSHFRHVVFMVRKINDKDDSIFIESFPSRGKAESFARALNSPASARLSRTSPSLTPRTQS